LRLSGGGVGVALAPSFHTADRQTYRRVVVVGVFFCAAFVRISLSMRPRVEETRALLKADRLTRTAGEARPAN
jgi:predicted membrane chloride channel (bestrophin family)